jgi:hypothetical protein
MVGKEVPVADPVGRIALARRRLLLQPPWTSVAGNPSRQERCAMISLTDKQLDVVMAAATDLTPEKRDVLLQRIAAHLERRGRFNDDDVAAAVKQARAQQPAA